MQLGVALYRKYFFKSLHTINFDNPVYHGKGSSSVVEAEQMNQLVTSSSTSAFLRLPHSSSVASSLLSTSTAAGGLPSRNPTSTTLVEQVEEEDDVPEVEPLTHSSSDDSIV